MLWFAITNDIYDRRISLLRLENTVLIHQLDRMVFTQAPRVILQNRGEDISEDEWGDINILEWMNVYDELKVFLSREKERLKVIFLNSSNRILLQLCHRLPQSPLVPYLLQTFEEMAMMVHAIFPG